MLDLHAYLRLFRRLEELGKSVSPGTHGLSQTPTCPAAFRASPTTGTEFLVEVRAAMLREPG